jgi:biopolymer transport protein ExbB
LIGDSLALLVHAASRSGLAAAPAPGAESAPDAAAGMSALDFIQAGGTIGYIIILLSFVAAAMAVVHLVRLRSSALAPEDTVAELGQLLSQRRVDEAIAYCEEPANHCFLTNVMRSGLLRYKRSPFGALELKAALEEAGQEQVARLSRSTDGLALVASIAPMLGLLGTVVGINGAFATISSAQGFSRPDQLAGDISLALVTTIMGLVLAIPATSAVTYFRNKIERLAAEAAVVVDELSIFLEAPATAAQQQSAAAGQSRVQQAPAQPGAQPQQPRRSPGDVPAAPVQAAPRAPRPDTPGA